MKQELFGNRPALGEWLQVGGMRFRVIGVMDSQMLGTLDRILSVLTMPVAALGSISLLVGGVGILTIMTTTVRERTSEVGLLPALGSAQRQVMVLFLGEAIVLSILGGLLGILSILALVGVVDWLAPNLPLQANWP